MSVALVACSKKKKKGIHQAKDVYTSPLFTYAFTYAQKHFRAVYILSAKYGLLYPTQLVQSYDETLNALSVAERRMWARKAAFQCSAVMPKGTSVYLFCGKTYREFLPALLPQMRFCVPLEGLKIGEQLHWYKERLS